jgi:uncharacterized protein
MSNEFIGKGWAFPLRTSATSGIAMVSAERELAESIQLILSTALGERPMRPEFGCGIHEHVFAPADDTTAGQIAYEVRLSLNRWEPTRSTSISATWSGRPTTGATWFFPFTPSP